MMTTIGVPLVNVLLVLFLRVSLCVGTPMPTNSSRAETTLRFVSVVHRHGERVPRLIYPTDPYKGSELWEHGPGQLLQQGMVTEFELGKFLRNRYDEFISAKYKPKEFFVMSSNIDRCLMSAQCVLAGLYPQIDAALPVQPIPVHSHSAPCDNVFLNTKPCALLKKEEAYVKTELQNKKLDDDRELVDYLLNHTGANIETLRDVERVHDNLSILEHLGLKLPDWAQKIYPERISSLARDYYLLNLSTPLLNKLKSGVLLNEILTNMKKKRNSTELFERKTHLYSAHDVTIIRLWRAMEIIEPLGLEKPTFGAALIYELHQVNDEYRVKILYKNGTADTDMTTLNIKGCQEDKVTHQDGMCNLDVFSSALESMAITDFEKECRL